MSHRFRIRVGALGLVAACVSHGPPPSTRRPAQPTGPGLLVLGRDGQPVPAPVVLVLKPSGTVLAIERGDDRGVVALDVEPGRYRFRVTAVDGYAVREVELAASTLPFRLEDNCEPVNGVASDDIPPNEIVWLRTVPGGDYFGAIVRADRTFRTCLPRGMYVLEADEREAPEFIFDVPANVRLDAYKRERIDVEPPSTVTVSSHRSIGELLEPSASIVGLGEANHGSREFVALRLSQTLSLARTHAVRYVALEAGAAEVFPLDDYVHGAGIDVRAAVSKLGYWMWDTEEFIGALSALRDYNSAASPSEQISLVGVDVQTSEAATAFIRAFAASMSPLQEEALSTLAAADNSGNLPEARAQILRDAFASMRISAPHSQRFRIELARLQIECRFAMLTTSTRAGSLVREEGMARMTDRLLEQLGRDRAVLWAHNGHISVDPNSDFIPLGARLRAKHGNKYVAVGVLMGVGTFRAWDEQHKVGVVPNTVKSPPSFALEGFLLRQFSVAAVFVSLKGLPPELARWIAIPRRTAEAGGQMPKQWSLRNHAASFDLVGFVPRVTPTTPTATGARQAQ